MDIVSTPEMDSLRTDETMSPPSPFRATSTRSFGSTPSTMSPFRLAPRTAFSSESGEGAAVDADVSTRVLRGEDLLAGTMASSTLPGRLLYQSFGEGLGDKIGKTLRDESGKVLEAPRLYWDFEKSLGSGAFATVALVRQKYPGEEGKGDEVAIKFYRQPWVESEVLKEMRSESSKLGFVRERLLDPGFSPHFARPYFATVVDRAPLDRNRKFIEAIPGQKKVGYRELPILGSEFADAGTLRDSETLPDTEVARSLLAQLLFAVDAMNRAGIQHRDISSGNVGLVRNRRDPFAFSLRDGVLRDGKLVYFSGDFSALMPVMLDFGLSYVDQLRNPSPRMYRDLEERQIFNPVTSLFYRAPEFLLNYEKTPPEERRGKQFNPVYDIKAEAFGAAISFLDYLIGGSSLLVPYQVDNKEFAKKREALLVKLQDGYERVCEEERQFEDVKELSRESAFSFFVCGVDTKKFMSEYMLGMVALNGFPPYSVLKYKSYEAPEVRTTTPLGEVFLENKRGFRDLFSDYPELFEKGYLQLMEEAGGYPQAMGEDWREMFNNERGRHRGNFIYAAVPALREILKWDPVRRKKPNVLLLAHPFFEPLRSSELPRFAKVYGEETAKNNLKQGSKDKRKRLTGGRLVVRRRPRIQARISPVSANSKRLSNLSLGEEEGRAPRKKPNCAPRFSGVISAGNIVA